VEAYFKLVITKKDHFFLLIFSSIFGSVLIINNIGEKKNPWELVLQSLGLQNKNSNLTEVSSRVTSQLSNSSKKNDKILSDLSELSNSSSTFSSLKEEQLSPKELQEQSILNESELQSTSSNQPVIGINNTLKTNRQEINKKLEKVAVQRDTTTPASTSKLANSSSPQASQFSASSITSSNITVSSSSSSVATSLSQSSTSAISSSSTNTSSLSSSSSSNSSAQNITDCFVTDTCVDEEEEIIIDEILDPVKEEAIAVDTDPKIIITDSQEPLDAELDLDIQIEEDSDLGNEILSDFVKSVSDLPNRYYDYFGSLWDSGISTVGHCFSKNISGSWLKIIDPINQSEPSVYRIAGCIFDNLKSLINEIKKIVENFTNGILEKAKSELEGLILSITGLFDGLWKTLNTVWTFINPVDWVKSIVSFDPIGELRKVWDSKWKEFSDKITEPVREIQELFKILANPEMAKAMMFSEVERYTEMLNKEPSEHFSYLGSMLGGVVINFAQGLIPGGGVAKIAKTILDKIQEVLPIIKKGFNMARLLVGKGVKVGNSTINLVKNQAGKIQTKVGDIKKALIEGGKGKLTKIIDKFPEPIKSRLNKWIDNGNKDLPQCLVGQKYDPIAKKCKTTQCQIGTVLNAQTGKCNPKEKCQAGYNYNQAKNTCQPIEKCKIDYIYNETTNKCVSTKCDEDSYFDTKTMKCVEGCEAEKVTNTNRNIFTAFLFGIEANAQVDKKPKCKELLKGQELKNLVLKLLNKPTSPGKKLYYGLDNIKKSNPRCEKYQQFFESDNPLKNGNTKIKDDYYSAAKDTKSEFVNVVKELADNYQLVDKYAIGECVTWGYRNTANVQVHHIIEKRLAENYQFLFNDKERDILKFYGENGIKRYQDEMKGIFIHGEEHDKVSKAWKAVLPWDNQTNFRIIQNYLIDKNNTTDLILNGYTIPNENISSVGLIKEMQNRGVTKKYKILQKMK
jgi:hypothetical protein